MDLALAYHGKRVFLTGHTGFKGSWLAWWLHRLGAEVAGYALPPSTQPSLWQALDLGRDIESIQSDIRDFARLKQAMKEFRPDLVFHLAAQALVLPSYEDPLGTFSTNLMGTVNLLEACRGSESLQAAVVVTTDKCYLNSGAGTVFKEDDPLGGADPYSASKACAEIAVAAYRHSFWGKNRGLATVRAGNVIGGGDWSAHRLMPDLVRAVQSGQTITLRHPEARRPWQHVLDPLHGYLALGAALIAKPEDYSSAWNFGPSESEARQVRELVELAGGEWQLDPEPAPPEATQLQLDSSKARRLLGWSPHWSLDIAANRTMAWYRGFAEGLPAQELCAADLEAHG
jgi:CDP-glucose 4,6-dehydratase